ncbi:MAG: isoaspartyl peptidase/L-asparaginase [Bacteroidetes bacterium]|nr:isoaspartyl peptidase/L-asparaginase [Bacteroidota bacterium]MBU1114932.1 isoaspartyl peptidase/L-asparaginase [Bacteroidota bacterium]MBU1798687.1 isoaspartyl peptidase/L-asparaginase [Bacteroidota bacterium]
MNKTCKLFILFFSFTLLYSCTNPNNKNNDLKFGIVIHGGAGTIEKQNYSNERIAEYYDKLNEALATGYSVLENGGSSIDAVEQTIMVLENSPLFNAGKGAVFTANGINELDAAIMDGSNLNAGAVAGITTIKNPIKLARKIMEKSKHVMLVGKGAEIFAAEQNLEIVDPSYFYTEERWQALQRIKEDEIKQKAKDESYLNNIYDYKFGTVGCAALDKNGNLAAGTSTGGMTNKKYGRVGDVPIIGAGTYANNNTCALSATGHGEFFIRNVVTHDISAMMEYKNITLNQAAEKVVMEKLVKQKGEGGVIGIDKNANITMTFNTTGMFRGFKTSDGKSEVKIFKE